VTKALEPVIIHGEPLYYYLAREVDGEKEAAGGRPRFGKGEKKT